MQFSEDGENELDRRRRPRPHYLAGGRASDDLKEAADVHFLNSLEGGQACLLVDCYADLTDGVALEEAFFIVEGISSSPSNEYASPIDRLRTILAAAEDRRGRSIVPPRLLQPAFLLQVCRGKPAACEAFVAFFRQLQKINNRKDSADEFGYRSGGDGRSVCNSYGSDALSIRRIRCSNITNNTCTTNSNSCSIEHTNNQPGSCTMAPTTSRRTATATTRTTHHNNNQAVDPVARPRYGHHHHGQESTRRYPRRTPTPTPVNSASRTKHNPKRVDATKRVQGISVDRTSIPPPPQPPPQPPPPPPPPPVPVPQGFVTARGRVERLATIPEQQYKSRGVVSGNARVGSAAASMRALKRNALASASAAPASAPAPAPAVASGAATTVGARGGEATGRPAGSLSAGQGKITAVALAAGTGAEIRKVAGRKGAGPFIGGAERGGHTRGVGEKNEKQTDASVPRRAAATGGVDTAEAGKRRSERRNVLRWMDSLGVKVDWSLLTPEEAPCHERFSSGELLCELAAAVDYTASGGRGLPLSEIPLCPGRFVLRGTCGRPANKARSRHNVRAALSAFGALGGVNGVWLRGEEAILEGDHTATWGLLGDVHRRYSSNRVRSLRTVQPRPRQEQQQRQTGYQREQDQLQQQLLRPRQRRQRQQRQQPQQQNPHQRPRSPIESTPPALTPPFPCRRHRCAGKALSGEGPNMSDASTSAPAVPWSTAIRPSATPTPTRNGGNHRTSGAVMMPASTAAAAVAQRPQAKTHSSCFHTPRHRPLPSPPPPPPYGHLVDDNRLAATASRAGTRGVGRDNPIPFPGSTGDVPPAYKVSATPSATAATSEWTPGVKKAERKGSSPLSTTNITNPAASKPPTAAPSAGTRRTGAGASISSRQSVWSTRPETGTTAAAAHRPAIAAAAGSAVPRRKEAGFGVGVGGVGGGRGGGCGRGGGDVFVGKSSAVGAVLPKTAGAAAAAAVAANGGCPASKECATRVRSCSDESGTCNTILTSPFPASVLAARTNLFPNMTRRLHSQPSGVEASISINVQNGPATGRQGGGGLTESPGETDSLLDARVAPAQETEQTAGAGRTTCGEVDGFRGSKHGGHTGQASARISASQAGDSASAETAKWLEWKPVIPELSSPAVGTADIWGGTRLLNDKSGVGRTPCEGASSCGSHNISRCGKKRSPTIAGEDYGVAVTAVSPSTSGGVRPCVGGTDSSSSSSSSSSRNHACRTSFDTAVPPPATSSTEDIITSCSSSLRRSNHCHGHSHSQSQSHGGTGATGATGASEMLQPPSSVEGAGPLTSAAPRGEMTPAARGSHATSSGNSALPTQGGRRHGPTCPSPAKAAVSIQDASFRATQRSMAVEAETRRLGAEYDDPCKGTSGGDCLPESCPFFTAGPLSGTRAQGACQAKDPLRGGMLQPILSTAESSSSCARKVGYDNMTSAVQLCALVGDNAHFSEISNNCSSSKNNNNNNNNSNSSSIFGPIPHTLRMAVSSSDPFARSTTSDLLPVAHQ